MNKKKSCFFRVGGKLACLVLTLCMALGALSVTTFSADTAEGKLSIVVLAADVEMGQIIEATAITTKEISAKNAPQNAITDTTLVVGKYAASKLYAGEYLYAEKLLDSVAGALKTPDKSKEKFIYVTDYIEPDTGKDVYKTLQSLIDRNPKRTLYFPDGEYIISQPLITPAAGAKSVSLRLSDGAVIKAAKSWESTDAMICLGYKEPDNNIRAIGAYFSLIGGTIDGNGVANGVSVGGQLGKEIPGNGSGGRESLVHNVLIKNTQVGLTIWKGGNNNSSDIDIDDVTIIGNGKPDSIGVYVDGYDNSLTNIKVYDVQTGFLIEGGGNLMRNIQLYFSDFDKCKDIDYTKTIGIKEAVGVGTDGSDTYGNGNWLLHCFSEDFATAFVIFGNINVIDNCHARWNTSNGGKHAMFALRSSGLSTMISDCKAEFFSKSVTNYFITRYDATSGTVGGSVGGSGKIEAPTFDETVVGETNYKRFLTSGGVIPLV